MHIATKSSKFNISKKKNLEKVVLKILSKIKIGDTILLYGDIGIGKTTSTRIFINRLGKKKKLKVGEVLSPTFNIVHEYLINDILVSHYDLYRLNSKDECNSIGIYEDIDKKITIVEWPEKLDKKPINRLELYFEYKNNFTSRSLSIKSYGRCKKYGIFKK
jgi:tRNA threonylcarbamoyl adenosine modification protein YjeE